MKAFSFDTKLVKSYENFTRSFSTIRSKDLRDQIDGESIAGFDLTRYFL